MKLEEKNSGWFFSSSKKVLSEEETKKIACILEESFQEDKNSKIRRSFLLKLDFILKKGKFSFLKSINQGHLEGFSVEYSDFSVCLSSVEEKLVLEAKQAGFGVKLQNLINNSLSESDITLKTADSLDYVWKSSFILNPPSNPTNSSLKLDVNKLNLLYNQTFSERVISFFSTKIEENALEEAYKGWDYLKNKTAERVKGLLGRPNQLKITVNPQTVYVPVNRYDYKKGKILAIQLGTVRLNTDNTVEFDLNLSNFNVSMADSFDLLQSTEMKLVEDISIESSLVITENPTTALNLSIKSVILNVNDYSFHLLQNIQHLLKPAPTSDCWATINRNSSTIKQNCLATAKIQLTNARSLLPEECFAVLSGGHVYFFKNSREEHFFDYFYLKDSRITRDDKEISLVNRSDLLLSFSSLEKAEQWEAALSSRIQEISRTVVCRTEEESKENVFIASISVKIEKIKLNYYDKTLLWSLESRGMSLEVSVNTFEIYFDVSLDKIEGTQEIKQCFRQFLCSNEENKIFSLSGSLFDRRSAKFEGIPMVLSCFIGAVNLHFDPRVIHSVLFKAMYNKEAEEKVLSDLKCESNSIQRKDSISSQLDLNLALMKVDLVLDGATLILVEPRQELTLASIHLSKSSFWFVKRSNMIESSGVLGSFTLFDLTNYPNTVSRQEEVNSKTKILCFDSQSSVSFKAHMINEESAVFKGKHTVVEAEVNSVKLFFYKEYVLRLNNYLTSDLLKAIPSDTPKTKVSLMEVRVMCKNPQIEVKGRYSFSQGIRLDLGEVHISNDYSYEKGRDKQDKDRIIPVNYFTIQCLRANLATLEGFKLIEETSLSVVASLLQLSEFEARRDISEIDRSINSTVKMSNLTLNLRQSDMLMLQDCVFLNLTYEDGKKTIYGEEDLRRKEKIFLMGATVNLKNISVNILGENEPLAVLSQDLMSIAYSSYSDTSSTTQITLENTQFKGSKDPIPLLSSSEQPNKASIFLEIYPDKSKNYDILLESGLLTPFPSTIRQLLRFFAGSVRNYKDSEHKPNEYIEDPERIPRADLNFLLKNSFIAVPTTTDDSAFKDSEMVCLTGEISLNYSRETLSQIKQYIAKSINEGNNRTSNLYRRVILSVKEYSLFTNKYSFLFNQPNRRIINKTSLVLNYVTAVERDFSYSSVLSIDHTPLDFTLSFKDSVCLAKMKRANTLPPAADTLIQDTAYSVYEQNKPVPHNHKIVLTLQRISATLIDNQSQTFFPFIKINFKDSLVSGNYSKSKGMLLNVNSNLKIKNFNWRASFWETTLEKTALEADVDSDLAKTKVMLALSSKEKKGVYLNISDMLLVQAGKVVSGWTEKINRVREGKKYGGESRTRISNHLLVNSSHLTLSFWKGVGGEVTSIGPGESLDLPYEQQNKVKRLSTQQEMFVRMNYDENSDSTLEIDSVGTKIHSLLGNKHCLLSFVSEDGFRKKIEFVSQTSFVNETGICLILTESENKSMLSPGKTVGLAAESIFAPISLNNNGKETVLIPEYIQNGQIMQIDWLTVKILRTAEKVKTANSSFIMNKFTIVPILTIQNSLPMDLCLFYEEKKSIVVPEEDSVDLTSFENQKLNFYFSLKFGENCSETVKMSLQKECLVKIKCGSDFSQFKIMAKLYKKGNKLLLLFYPVAVLSNETNLPFSFFYNKYEMAGNNKITLLSDREKLCCKLDAAFSESFNINAVGFSSIIRLRNGNCNSEFVLQSSLKTVKDGIFTNLFRLTPKFVLSNQLNFNLVFKNVLSKEVFILDAKERTILKNFDSRSLFDFSILENNDINASKWGYSCGNHIQREKLYTVAIRDGKNTVMCNIERKVFDKTTFIIISEANRGKCELLVKSNVEGVFIETGDTVVMPWTSEIVEKTENMHFMMADTSLSLKMTTNCVTVDNSRRYKLPHTEYTTVFNKEIGLKIFNDGNKIVVEANEIVNRTETDSSLELLVKCPNFGISLVGDLSKTVYDRKELLFINCLENTFYLKTERFEGKSQLRTQLNVNEIQIDNSLQDVSAFPVLLFPVSKEKTFFNLNLALEKEDTSNTYKITEFNYLIQAFKIKCNTMMVESLLRLNSNISKSFEKPFFDKLSAVKPEWKLTQLNSEANELFVETAELSPLEVELYFMNDNNSSLIDDKIGANPLLHPLVKAMTTINGAPLFLGGKMLSNVYGNLDEVAFTLGEEYKESLTSQVYKVIGSIEIIGNPVKLASTLGRGFKEFYDKPAKGIVKGPIQGIGGFIEGSAGLVKNTVEGTLGAASSVGSGISKGLRILAMDKKYKNQVDAENAQKRPENVGQGVIYGLESVAGGVFSGVKGIFSKPIKGAKKGSILGFGKGLVQGIGGAVFKPVSGVVDLVSKTTEGLKNGISSEEVESRKRLGLPLYGKEKVIKGFDSNDSKIKKLIEKKCFDLKEVDFEKGFTYSNRNELQILVLLSDTLLLINKDFKVKLDIERSSLFEITRLSRDEIALCSKKDSQGGYTQYKIQLSNENEQKIEEIQQTLEIWSRLR